MTTKRQQRVLVVDDEQVIAQTLAVVLGRSGFDAIAFTNPLKALEAARTEAPDLVISDVMMPEMDGDTLLRMIRGSDRWHEMPVIVLTGVADDHVLIERARALDIQDEVPKATFDFDDLLNRVKQHLPQAAA